MTYSMMRPLWRTTSGVMRVDGNKKGPTPLPALDLSVGPHQIRCEPPNGKPTKVAGVTVLEGQTARYAFKLDETGQARERRDFAQLVVPTEQSGTTTGAGADGLAVDEKGRLYVATTVGVLVGPTTSVFPHAARMLSAITDPSTSPTPTTRLFLISISPPLQCE